MKSAAEVHAAPVKGEKTMKKIAALMLTLCLLTTCSFALAAGKLEVTQETYVYTEPYEGSFQSYCFAELTNTGDKNVEFGSGVLEILNAEGDVTDTDDAYISYPNVIAPGEKAYVRLWSMVSDAEKLEDISDYTLTLTGKTSKENVPVHLTASAVVREGEQWGEKVYTMVATVTNETSETVYQPNVVLAAYDADGKLLYADVTTLYSVGIPAGQTVEVLITVDSSVSDQWTETPATVEAIVYVED